MEPRLSNDLTTEIGPTHLYSTRSTSALVHLIVHWLIVNKYQLSLTNPRDAPYRGKRAANKGGRSGHVINLRPN